MKPAGAVFDATWRRSCHVGPINKRHIGDLIRQHYLHDWPKNVQLAFGLRRRRQLLGVTTYSGAVGETLDRFGSDSWELSRLVIIDRVPTNAESFFIAATIRYIKRNYPNVACLVAFADPTHGHQGTVYRASNWAQHPHPSKHLFVYMLRPQPPPRRCSRTSTLPRQCTPERQRLASWRCGRRPTGR